MPIYKRRRRRPRRRRRRRSRPRSGALAGPARRGRARGGWKRWTGPPKGRGRTDGRVPLPLSSAYLGKGSFYMPTALFLSPLPLFLLPIHLAAGGGGGGGREDQSPPSRASRPRPPRRGGPGRPGDPAGPRVRGGGERVSGGGGGCLSMSCKALATLSLSLSLSLSLLLGWMSLHRRAVVAMNRRRGGVPRFVLRLQSEHACSLVARPRWRSERGRAESGGGGDVVLHLHCLLNDSLQIAAL